MSVDEAIAVFSSYSAAEQQDFLAQLMHELTVVARDGYEVGGEGLTDPRRLRLLNEVQHRLSMQLLKLLRGDSRRYADDDLVRIVLEQPQDEALAFELGRAFARVAARRLTAA
jgi:cob(I)alamin adenosyltransferase